MSGFAGLSLLLKIPYWDRNFVLLSWYDERVVDFIYAVYYGYVNSRCPRTLLFACSLSAMRQDFEIVKSIALVDFATQTSLSMRHQASNAFIWLYRVIDR